MPAGINMPGGTFDKINKCASWKITLQCKKMHFFVANDTFFNTKVVIFKILINLLYELRSMPGGKESKN